MTSVMSLAQSHDHAPRPLPRWLRVVPVLPVRGLLLLPLLLLFLLFGILGRRPMWGRAAVPRRPSTSRRGGPCPPVRGRGDRRGTGTSSASPRCAGSVVAERLLLGREARRAFSDAAEISSAVRWADPGPTDSSCSGIRQRAVLMPASRPGRSPR